jgi:hypothetical protein
MSHGAGQKVLERGGRRNGYSTVKLLELKMYKKCKQLVPCKAQKYIMQKSILWKQHCTLKKSGAEYLKLVFKIFSLLFPLSFLRVAN